MKIAISTCTVILLAAGATTLLAQHQSQDAATHGMAYKMLDDACQFCASVDQSKFVVRVLIQPRDKNVRRSDIHLTIKSASKGSIPVQLDDKGQIINFPHDPDLRRENPPVVKEAPKIPLTMILTTYLPEPDGLTFRYSLLGDDLAEVNKAVNTANKMILGSYLGELSPYKHDIEGVIFVFPKASVGKAAVEIASVSGIKKFVADKSGCVRLTLDPVLVTENPEVTLSERPQYIVPNLPHP